MATSQGNSWQLAVAVPLRNHTFEFGQTYVAKLQLGIEANSQYIQVSTELYPTIDLYLQYRDQVLIGPSSHSNNKGASEHVTISGILINTVSKYARIYLLNKNNKYKYNAGDRISFYGTGLAGGWEIGIPHFNTWPKRWFSPQGVQRGAISMNQWPNFDHNPSLGDGYYDAFYGATGAFLKIQRVTNQHSFFLDLNEVYGDKIQYIIDPILLEAGVHRGRIAMQEGTYTSSIKALLGDYHRGGWRKQYAQRIAIWIDANTPQGFFLTQKLVRSGPEDIRDRSLLIPYQYYRVGGRFYIDATFCSAKVGYDNYYLALILRPHDLARDVSHIERVGGTFAQNTTDNDTWINYSTVGLLQSGLANTVEPSIALWFGNNGIVAANAGDLILYIDDMYVEHAGGVQYAYQDGCLDFGRYSAWPDEDSLEIEKIPTSVSTSLYGRKEKFIITCRMNYVSQAFWDQFELIMEWQEKGYLLNLHSYINDLPHTLMGKVYISEYAKDNWDLSLRSFTLKFIEE